MAKINSVNFRNEVCFLSQVLFGVYSVVEARCIGDYIHSLTLSWAVNTDEEDGYGRGQKKTHPGTDLGSNMLNELHSWVYVQFNKFEPESVSHTHTHTPRGSCFLWQAELTRHVFVVTL